MLHLRTATAHVRPGSNTPRRSRPIGVPKEGSRNTEGRRSAPAHTRPPAGRTGGSSMTYVGRLPAPTTENWDWQVHALCRGMDSLVFFHPWGERGPERDDRDRRAKAVCADCPVIGLPGLRVDRWADRGGATAPARKSRHGQRPLEDWHEPIRA